MIYTYAAILIVILVLIFLIIRWWNLPKVIEERRESADAAQKRRFERRDRFRRLWGWGRREAKPSEPPALDVKPDQAQPQESQEKLPEIVPPIYVPGSDDKPEAKSERRRWLPWLRRKK